MKKGQNFKAIRILNLGLALMTLIFVSVLVWFCFFSEKEYETRLGKHDVTQWSEGWEYAQKLTVTLPFHTSCNRDVPIAFSNVLPDTIPDGSALCFSSNYATQEIFIGNRLAYSYGAQDSLPIGRMNGNIRILVPLLESDAGQTVTIISTSHYSREFTFNPVLIGTRESLIAYIMEINIWRVVIAPLLVLIAVLVLALGIYHGCIAGDTHQTVMFYFAAFTFSAASWIICSGDVLQFFSNKNGTACTISFISLMLLPTMFAGFLKHICLSHEKALQYVEWIGYGNLFIQLLLYVANQADPMEVLVFTHSVMIITMCVALFALLGNCREDKYRFILFLLFLIFLGGCVAGLVDFYRHPGRGTDAAFVAGGLLVFSLGLLVILESKELAGAKEALQTMLYKNMAYTDALTGLSNRMALEKDVDDIIDHLAEGKWVVFIMCDLNRLKQTNDTYGHEAGDKMIQDAAACIREAIPEEAHCYRLGGDEFGILLSGSEITAWYLIDKVEESMSKYNVDHEITLSMAMGSATAQFSREQDGFFKELYKRADDMMYEVKRKQHLERAQARQS